MKTPGQPHKLPHERQYVLIVQGLAPGNSELSKETIKQKFIKVN
jgi:hypothetical protein